MIEKQVANHEISPERGAENAIEDTSNAKKLKTDEQG